MAFANETRTTTVVTDASQSVSELGKLELKYAELNQRLKDLKGRSRAVREEKRALREELRNMAAKIDDERQKVGVLGLSYNQLNRGLSNTRREMNALIPTMKNYESEMLRLTKQEKQYQDELKKRQDLMKGPKDQKGFFGSMGDAFSSKMGGGLGAAALAGGVAGAVVGIGSEALSAAKQGMMESIERARQKSKALSGMAAITGLDLEKDAKDLRYFGDSAEYLGKKFNMAVPDVIDGFAKVGSIKPELLGAKEALVSLTEEAITLSKADGMLSVEEATISLVGSLNQFNVGADQSTRFMNVLAASAKAGSAEINQVAESFKVSGAVLSASNISFEQSNALVQALAKKQILGSEAGTALRNVFSKLMVQNKELNPSIVGLNTALENLSKLSPQKMVKLFGQENLVAAMTLVQFRKEVRGMTAEMTGTTEATDQARKRMTNLDEDIKSLGKAWDGLFSLNGDQESSFQKIIKSLTEIFNWIGEIRKEWHFTWEDLTPITSLKKLLDIKGEVEEKRKIQDQYNREMDARKKGNADYLAGTTEENLNKYEGKTTFDKEAAYAREFIQQARVEYKKLDAQIAYIKKAGLDGKNYDIGKMREELARLAGRVVAGKNAQVDIEKRRKANEEFTRKLNQDPDKDKDKDAEKRKRHLELLAKQELDNQNRIAEIRTRALADEEERDVQLRQLKYAKELQEVSKQEGDKTELYKALEEELQQDIAEIRKKYAEKWEKERIETASRLADAIRAIEMQDAQTRVQRAESKENNNPEIFDARRNLSFVQEAQDLERLDEAHRKEQEKYKDNASALFNIEIAYQKQVFAIRKRGANERLALQEEENKAEKAAAAENTRQQLAFETTQAEWSGNPRRLLDAKLAMLQFQMRQELDIHGLTEEKKAEITRRYMAEQAHEMKLFRDAQMVNWLEIFQAGFQGIAQLTSVQHRNEETKSNDAHERETRQLDARLKKGLISQEQYSAQKEKIDAQYEEKQRQIRRKQAIAEKKAALFEAAIAIPLNVLKAGPNPFAIALALVTGAAQLAAISAQEIPEFARGGRAKGPWGQGIIARIGEKGEEQITPAWQMADPAARPYLDWLEQRRVSGIAGGNGAPPPGIGGSGSGTDPEVARMLAAVNATLGKLNEQIPKMRAKLVTDELDDYLNDTALIKKDAMGK